MQKITKKYINNLVLGRDWEEKEVDFEDPELVDTKDITSFYFLEQTDIVDGEDIYTGKTKKISPTYHVGTRISIIEALELTKGTSSYDYCVQLFKNHPNLSICKTEIGHLIPMWNEDDITIEEYVASKNKSKN